MNRIGMLSLICAGMIAIGCNRLDNDRSADMTPGREIDTVGTTGDRKVDNARHYVLDMLAHGTSEVHLGRLAQQRAQSPEVKQFATMMVQDHTKAGDKLKKIAAQRNIQGATNLDDDHTKLMDRLSALSGAEFDRAYIKAMVDNHQDAIDRLQQRADETDKTAGTTGSAAPKASDDTFDMQVNQWAANALPTVRMHLERAKDIQDRLGSGFTDKMKSVLPDNKDRK